MSSLASSQSAVGFTSGIVPGENFKAGQIASCVTLHVGTNIGSVPEVKIRPAFKD